MTDDEPELELDPDAVVQVEPRSPEPRGGVTVSGLPFPSSTDPLMDGAAAIQNLATALEARVGLPNLADCNVVPTGFSNGLVTPSTLNSPFPGGWGAITTEYSDGSAIIQHSYQWGASTGNEHTRTRDGAAWGPWIPVFPASCCVITTTPGAAGNISWTSALFDQLKPLGGFNGSWAMNAPFKGVYAIGLSCRTADVSDHLIHKITAATSADTVIAESWTNVGVTYAVDLLGAGDALYAQVGAALTINAGVPARFWMTLLYPVA